MNERVLETWLFAHLEKLSETTGKAVDFAQGELPLFIQEFLTFYTIWYWLLAIVCLSIFLSVTYGAFYWAKRLHDASAGLSWLIAGVVMILNSIPLAVGIDALKYAMMVTFAPRVFLLTELVKLLK